MCTYRHKAPNGVYYFRMGIPVELRPFMDGLREIKYSLRTKDPAAAKALIPDHTKAAYKQLEQARLAAARAVNPKAATAALSDPFAGMTLEQFEEEQKYRFEQAWADAAEDDRMEAAETYVANLPDDHPARLIQKAERERGDRYQIEARRSRRWRGRGAEDATVAAHENSGEKPRGSGVYLDTDIVDGWAREKKPSPKGKDAYWRDAKLFNSMMGRKSVEQITKADVMAYKRKLIDEGRTQINVRDRLAYLRTLLKWAAGEDLIPDNPAKDVRMAVTERGERRSDFTTDDLNALFAGPVYSKGERSKAGYGEAAYWLPMIALFMGARREEIGQLRVCDVKLVPYIDEAEQRREVWCMDVTDTPEDDPLPTQVKNEASNRLVPLHPKLIELGFVDYVAKLPNQEGRVFPELKPVGIGQKLTDKWGQWFSKYKVQCGIVDKTKVFHSFRHTWKTHAVDAGIAERICREFQGHEGTDAADKYGAAPAMRVLVAAIASYRVPGLVLPK